MVKIALLCDSHSGIENIAKTFNKYISIECYDNCTIVDAFQGLNRFVSSYAVDYSVKKTMWMGLLNVLSTSGGQFSLECKYVMQQLDDINSESVLVYNVFDDQTVSLLQERGFKIVQIRNTDTDVVLKQLKSDFGNVEPEEVSNLTKTLSPELAPNFKYSLAFSDPKDVKKTILGILYSLS